MPTHAQENGTTTAAGAGRTGRRRRVVGIGSALAIGVGTAVVAGPVATTGAVPPAPGDVFDDFEDGDTSDWGFFGGNLAGGGGGPANDRPAQGSGYFSTGWGGEGTTSSFYGGAFKNLPDTEQIALPADPWFNMWVYVQSETTVDAFTLELTLREDTNGDGWSDGSEDSIGLDTRFTSADFDDRWHLLSAPLGDFFDRGTGGNGVFDGAVDEMVIVFGGVEGGPGSVIEFDVDDITFTSGAPAAIDTVVFDDMEHGDPLNNGWFAFNGSVGGGGLGPATEVPPVDGGSFAIDTGWGSGGAAGFYGGFGRGNPVDLSGAEFFNFWIDPRAGQEYTLEINLQDDDTGNGVADPAEDDDEFQFNCVVSDAGPCAVAGGGWQLVSIPLDDFFDDNSFFPGGNGVLDPTPVTRGGNGELVNAVFAVVGTGTDANFVTDHWTFSSQPADASAPAPRTIIDDFENGLPNGAAVPNGEPLGFYTFAGAGSGIEIATESTPPAPILPEVGEPNDVLRMDLDSTSFAGFIHAFENENLDAWVPQDWSTSEGISFWFHGAGSGAGMFIDILDNRTPGSTTDDAERWTVAFTDDTVGWKLYEFPFSMFTRKEIGNGAPNDGLGLFEMHGYAIGALGTGGPQTFYLDQVSLYGVAEPPALAANLSVNNTFIDEGTTGEVAVKLTRPMGPDDPAQVSIGYRTEVSTAVPGEDYTPTSGTLTFVNGGPNELTFPVETFDDGKFTGDLRVVVRLVDPVDVERGALFQGSVLIRDDDPFDPDLRDDFEQGSEHQWETHGPVAIEAVETTDRPGQDDVEHALAATVTTTPLDPASVVRDVIADLELLAESSTSGDMVRIANSVERLEAAIEPDIVVDGWLVEPTGTFFFGRIAQAITPLERVVFFGRSAALGAQDAIDRLVALTRTMAVDTVDRAEALAGPDPLVDAARDAVDLADVRVEFGRFADGVRNLRRAWRNAVAAAPDAVGSDVAAAVVDRDFPLGQDWTGTETLDFWFEGTGSGEEVTVTLKDNRAPDPGPAGWSMVWSDEFDGPDGAPPNPANWSYELGDVTPDGKNGWGNEELQYYTSDTDNSATDGEGNLVITLEAADGDRECYYGPCEFESARLITQHKAEFAYGRIESRLKVPTGGDGLWPAFWSLGTDITYNPWPGAGEIDIMEYVSRLPEEIFGTIHGPGYAGGESFSGIFDFGERVDLDYHTYAVEWEPEKIRWYLDGELYHEAEPSDVAPNQWVFEKPFFLLLNFAIGGNFGGTPDPANTYPQEYFVDYVRVYQGPDTAERFETSFVDDVAGWQQVSIPVTDFVRSADQPDGAPDDGLGLDEVWGYDITLPTTGTYHLDQFRTVPTPPPSALVVTTDADSGDGSLRDALALIGPEGTITFDPSLASATIALTSGQLTVDESVIIDASGAPGLTVSGSNASRVFEIAAGADVEMHDLSIVDGAGAGRGGGILNNGALLLDHVVLADNTEGSAGPPSFDLGGGGIFNGENARLDLVDSTVRDNESLNQPGGGIYGFFGSTVNIVRSTVSGNVGGDVAGGLRSLGDVTVDTSTFSGNVSTAWHGGGIFHTDGVLTVVDSTFAENVAPAGTASGILVATFGAPASATIENSILQGTGGAFACALEGGAAATITSLGSNVIGDLSCNPIGIDLSDTDAGLGPLADNGGPTFTHLPGPASAAIDVVAGTCGVVDQRGIARPQGETCDAGSVEVVQ